MLQNMYFNCTLIIGSMIGLDMIHGQTLSGQQIDNMTDHQLKAMVNNVSVFYRVTPRHKLTIIKVLNLI